jgi:hypothetical protein
MSENVSMSRVRASILFLMTLSTPFAWGQKTAKVTEQRIISYAKALDVSKLDPSLSSQRLDQWLQSGPAHLDTVKWEMSDCDLKPDISNPNYVAPLCAKVRFKRGSCGGWAIIRVGTFRDGIGGTPHLEYIFAAVGSNYDRPPESRSLSDLPRLLDKAESSIKPD